MNSLQKKIIEHWQQLNARERIVLGCGSVLVGIILFYALLWQPWHRAIDTMQNAMPGLRANLVWMRQQSELINSGVNLSGKANVKGQGQSLLSVLEQTAKARRVQGAIVQMSPGQNDSEVRVVLEEVDFNRWVQWVDMLFQQYAVSVVQASVERDDDQPNVAEIRMTFARF